VTKFPLSGSPE